jgi:hypothetical protein
LSKVVNAELADAGRATRLRVPRFNPEVDGGLDSLGKGAGGVALQVCFSPPRQPMLDAVIVDIDGIVVARTLTLPRVISHDSSVVMAGSSALDKKVHVKHVSIVCTMG